MAGWQYAESLGVEDEAIGGHDKVEDLLTSPAGQDGVGAQVCMHNQGQLDIQSEVTFLKFVANCNVVFPNGIVFSLAFLGSVGRGLYDQN